MVNTISDIFDKYAEEKPEHHELLREAAALDRRVCGCGTIRQALDIAIKEVAREFGTDCNKWHMTIAALMAGIRTNAMHSKGCSMAWAEHPETDAEKMNETVAEVVQEMVENAELTAKAIMYFNKELIINAIDTKIRNAHNKREHN